MARTEAGDLDNLPRGISDAPEVTAACCQEPVDCGPCLGCRNVCRSCCCPPPLHCLPGMIGDYFGGYGAPVGGLFEIDRLMVYAPDLDAPVVLPPGSSTLTITEAGPVPIVSGALNLQQIQTALRAGSPLPTLMPEGEVLDSATLTTTLTISQIQALLASTPEAYDIVPLAVPPTSYEVAVAALFAARNTAPGVTAYDEAGSGAMLQSAGDTLTGGEDFDAFYFYAYNAQLNVPLPGSAFSNMGRLKVATGNSALPRDRIYFRYGLFDGVAGPVGGLSVDRFTPGFEKAFYNGLLSLELRAPFAATASNSGTLGPGGVVGSDVVFGDLTLYAKGLLHQSSHFALSGGLGISIPTASDVTVNLADGTPLVAISHESVHLKPFLAALYARRSGWFAQGFLELDVDTNGDPVDANLGAGLAPVGRLNDATYLFADVGLGYRMVRCGSCITAISPTVELHYNTALGGADRVQAGLVSVGGLGGNLDAVNATIGGTMELGRATNVSAGYVVPLGGGDDQQLDGAFRLSLEYRPR